MPHKSKPLGSPVKPRGAVMVKSGADGKLRLQAQLPGWQAGDIDLAVSKEMLTLRGERRQSEERKYRASDRRKQDFGPFQHTFRLPAGVRRGQIEAIFKHGVLTVTIPKSGGHSPESGRQP